MSKQNESNPINIGQHAAKRVAMGVIGGAVGQSVNIVARLLIVPTFLWAWGKTLYGEWLSLSAIVAYLQVLDLGIQTYAVNRLTQLYAAGSMKQYNRVLHSALGLYVRIALIGFVLFCCAAEFAPIASWLRFSQMDKQTTTLLAIALSLQLVLTLPNGAILGAYRSCLEYPKYTFLSVITRTAMWLGTALALLAKSSPPIVAVVQIVPGVTTTLYAIWDIPRRHDQIRFGFTQYDRNLAVSFLGPSLLFFLIQSAQSLTVQGSTMMVASMLGPAAVATFVTTRMVPGLLRQIMSTLTHAVAPELTALETHQEYGILRKNHVTLVKISFGLVATMGVALHFIGPHIIPRWTIGKIAFNPGLLDVFLGYAATQTIWLVSATFPTAFNKHGTLSGLYVGNAIVGLTSAAVLARSHGLMGVVMGLWLGDLIFGTLSVPLLTCRLLASNPISLFWEAVLRGLPLLAIQYAICAFIRRQLIDSWFMSTIAISALSLTILLVGGYAFWLSKTERTLAKRGAAKVLQHIRRRIKRT